MRTFVALLVAVSVAAAAVIGSRGNSQAQQSLGLDVNTSTGAYTISVNGAVWLSSGDTFVTISGKRYSTSDASLKLTKYTTGEGFDAEGNYAESVFTWLANTTPFITQFRVYSNHISFAQIFPEGMNATSISSKDGVSTSFPSFAIGSGPITGFVSFKGDMCGSGSAVGGWPKDAGSIGTGISGTGPIVMFDDDAENSLVFSALSNFMAFSQAVSDNKISFGVMGQVQSLPEMYVLESVLVLSSGINNAMEEWGDVLLGRYGKSRTGFRNDYAVRYLGYSTDNGAYYYYQTEPNKDYQDTVLDVAAYAKSVGLPYRYILLDSWWYFKGTAGGVSTWDPMPSVFPDGLEYLFNQTGWQQQLHNRYWSANNTYAKQNGGKWDFLIEGQYALPLEQAFWDDLMLTKKKSGMFMYEQDWLDDEFDWVPSLQQDATLARQWMLQMGSAAERAGVTFQACMSHVRHILQMVESPAMTNARASGDYHPGNSQWYIGISSLLAWATGIAPTKDNYWSTSVQSDTHYGPSTSEPYNRMQAVVSTLSAGPVAPSDKVGSSDVALIMRACMQDGTLLSPDRPATEIDAYFVYQATRKSGLNNGHIWTTYSTINQNLRFSYVFGILIENTYKLTPQELGYAADTPLLFFETNSTSKVQKLSSSLIVNTCRQYDFQLYTVVPVFPTGWALLGEPNKWVSVSAVRFAQIATTSEGVSVQVSGAPGETVIVNFADPALNVITTNCVIPSKGRTRVIVTAGEFTCDNS